VVAPAGTVETRPGGVVRFRRQRLQAVARLWEGQSRRRWSLAFSTAAQTAGSYTVFAQATDSDGVTGDPFDLTLQVV
jgi:hypothetical protein